MKAYRNLFALLPWMILSISPPGQANMRAPVTLHHPSSSLLSVASALTVNSVRIDIRCQIQCALQISYTISSRADLSTRLTFILPTDVPIQAMVNRATSPVTRSRPFTPEDEPASRTDFPRIEYTDDLYKASFSAVLHTGINRVEISYQQPTGRDERSFGGYFSGWKSLHELRYELWPLHEWKLNKQFSMQIKVSFLLGSPAHDGVLFRTYATRNSPVRNGEQKTTEQNPLRFEQTWGHNFPARLEWVFGKRKFLEGLRQNKSSPE